MQADEDLLRQHYCDLKDRPFFPGLVSYMSSGPVVAMVNLFIFIFPHSAALGHFEFNNVSPLLLINILPTFHEGDCTNVISVMYF